jgi:alpha/beta superfamily hydrolase
MGGHVAAAAAATLHPVGLFVLAPAFYISGFEAHTPREVNCPTVIVHGWRDDIVPVDNSIRWAREHLAALHVLDSDHRLEDQIETVCRLLAAFIGDLD